MRTVSVAAAPSTVSPASRPELDGLAGFVVDVVDSLGAVGVGLLVAAENLFPPIPSEVVLPVARYVASQGRMNVVAAILAATVGSLLGVLALYAFGAAVGRDRLRQWIERMPLLDVADLDRTERWFDRHGGQAVLLGRCVPVVRSLISIPAGVERMPLRNFVPYTCSAAGCGTRCSSSRATSSVPAGRTSGATAACSTTSSWPASLCSPSGSWSNAFAAATAPDEDPSPERVPG